MNKEATVEDEMEEEVHDSTSRVCNSTLAKYVFEKWRNVMPKLSASLQKHRVAMEHYRKYKLQIYFTAMANYSK